MTTLTAPRIQTIRAPAADAVSARRAALLALDPAVRALLQRRLVERDPSLRVARALVCDLTVYDEVYEDTPAGGHWTVAVRRPLFLSHQVASYSVTLEFDADNRPARFNVSGAGEAVSDDASLDALDRALGRALVTGPLRTWAPSVVPGISL